MSGPLTIPADEALRLRETVENGAALERWNRLTPKHREKLNFELNKVEKRITGSGWQVFDRGVDGLWAIYGKAFKVCTSIGLEDDNKLWLHLSMSHPHRLPSWDEMREVKTRFLGEDSIAYLIFPPKSEYVNIHRYCLHLWQCLEGRVTPDFTGGTGSI